MAQPYFTAKHVESMALLPNTLEVGRAYFVDDEQVIVIDHGKGPVIYGGAAGPQGIAGEPLPQIQSQIDSLVESSFTTQRTIWEINQRELERHEQIQQIISSVKQEVLDVIQAQSDTMDTALNIIAKSIANLYPAHYPPEDSQDDPLDNETVSTPAGSWVIQQTTLKDGTIVLNLEATDLVIDTIQIGDSVDFDGATWTVEDVSTQDGVTSITIRP